MYLTPEQIEIIKKSLNYRAPDIFGENLKLDALNMLKQAQNESERRKYLPSSSDSGLYLVLKTIADLKQQEVRIALNVPFEFHLITRELVYLHKSEINEPFDFDIFLQHLGRVLQSNMTKALGLSL